MPLAKKRWNPFLLYPIITIQVLPYIFRILNTNECSFYILFLFNNSTLCRHSFFPLFYEYSMGSFLITVQLILVILRFTSSPAWLINTISASCYYAHRFRCIQRNIERKSFEPFSFSLEVEKFDVTVDRGRNLTEMKNRSEHT